MTSQKYTPAELEKKLIDEYKKMSEDRRVKMFAEYFDRMVRYGKEHNFICYDRLRLFVKKLMDIDAAMLGDLESKKLDDEIMSALSI